MSHSLSLGPDWLSSAPTKACMFHKIIVASILHDKKLKISSKFVKSYGEELSSLATVSVPNGRFWVVELEKIDNKIWFDSGWNEFVEFYSIRVGHLLVFRYEGNSHFNIYIFDLTEVKYPFSSSRNLQEMRDEYPTAIKEEVQDDDIKEMVRSATPCLTDGSLRSKTTADCVSCNHIGPAAILQRSQSNRSRVTGSPDKLVSVISSEGETKKRKRHQRAEATSQKLEHRSVRVETASQAFTRRWRPVTVEEKRMTLRLADMFTSANPFFKVILRPSYVYGGFLLHVPSFFSRKYLNFSGFVTLEAGNGNRWSVRCCYSNGHAKLIKGWNEFAWGNNLEEGDVCVFELTDLKDVILKVTIFRVLEEAPPLTIESGPC